MVMTCTRMGTEKWWILDQRSENHDERAKSGLLPVLVKQTWWRCSHSRMVVLAKAALVGTATELSGCDRDVWLTLAPQKSRR
jgi:hypothetical protein